MFDYELGSPVAIKCSGETGQVIARAQYKNSQDQYLIRYKSADGRAVEEWWSADAIQ